jgi:hypothetical protein
LYNNYIAPVKIEDKNGSSNEYEDYEYASLFQGYWGYSPKAPFMDDAPKNIAHTQQELSSLVKKAIYTSLYM